ncbi:hypothetical protein LP123_05970 [Moraxella bovis]|uniref:Lipoprotein n=1 Tax=Moraxella bovis TaxID=476 RepID=A0AAX3EXI9_MORBO|nr:hypothetical protein [Moraxella bovis]UYZ74766.1 hypothetical protein LP093_08275 [Moraxella bovis]UYZ79307.1 hypothetical protein LP115_05600 [Moraxella bovis]UYZ80115.1 hypothetical protein LP113_08645 [Moraxella bovis]UYZ87787.1 hypothetical protein LP094_05605 [Moraxella bovis]UYZ93192.1 hypothetical protein LP103_05470 [Moraxella bovis]
MNSINKSDLALQLLSIILLALTLHSCVANLDKQAEADHQKCLSWQADGYNVRCGGRP